MKKFVLFIIVLMMMLPINIKALSLGTKIIGNEKAKPGSNIVYTVVLDYELDNYAAEITYDRDVLNLVDVKEININTTTSEFNVEKNNPIVINVTSKTPIKIVYMLEFNVKNYLNVDETEIVVNTTKASSDDEELTTSEEYKKITIVRDSVISTDEISPETNQYKIILNDIKNVLNEYGNPITYVSLGLNLLLIIILIFNLKRKKVDYDF